jgi:hypothetical protein
MRDDEFEWDDRKAERNKRKHKVGFTTARRAFDDEHAIDELDTSDDYGEDRYVLLGAVDSRVLHITYVERAGRRRFISARKAMQHEQLRYEKKR